MKFSQRMGLNPVSKPIQIKSLDIDTRNSLWNIFNEVLCSKIKLEQYNISLNNISELMAKHLWHNLYKFPTDAIPGSQNYLLSFFRKKILEDDWYKAFELIEETVSYLVNVGVIIDRGNIERVFNQVLEREFSGYRFINGLIAPISNQHEINEIEGAIFITSSYTHLNGCNIHLEMALAKLSDKLNPDYRNSIKESISAVESLAKIISGKTSDTLNSAIDRIKGKLKIHRNLEQGLKNLYNYTSDGDGIRHGIMEEPTCDFEDAKFMLISCSAFINYLVVKANKANIVFDQK